MNQSGCVRPGGAAGFMKSSLLLASILEVCNLQDGAMSRAGRLTPFSYVILALVGRDGAGPHDIVRMMREGAIFWTTSESHYYAEPRRLATLGFLQGAPSPAARDRGRIM